MKKLFLFILFFTFSLFAQTNNLISPSNFKASFEALESLKILEGYRAYVYYDNNQNIIFGYGHLVLPQEEEFLKTHFGYETILVFWPRFIKHFFCLIYNSFLMHH